MHFEHVLEGLGIRLDQKN